MALTFSPNDGIPGTYLQVPCGKCIGCRMDKAKDWAVRCLHESKMHKENCFITLTYDDEHIPMTPEGLPTLRKEDFQKFMKRLRKKYGEGIRFFHCGEYGSQTYRPHHHACIFGHDFKDKELFTIRNKVAIYTSEELNELWPFGVNNTVGEVTYESAGYVARYIMKKITGPDAEDYYEGREPEYITMSMRPGVGRPWLDKYLSDTYPHDYHIIKLGIKVKPSRYYDKIYDGINSESLKMVKNKRKEKIEKYKYDNNPCRLEVREKLLLAKIKLLKRSVE